MNMSAKLQKPCDKQARNNPYTSHKGKVKIPTDKNYAASDFSKTQPQFKKSAPLTASKSGQKALASHVNTFVPIPELGIYSPDQHVLQNGTFAQHCHNRDFHGRVRGTGTIHQVDNDSSSFGETTNNFGYQKKGVLHGFDNQVYRHKNDPSMCTHHVPTTRQHNHSIGSHQEVHNLGRKPVRNEIFTKNNRRVSNSVRSNRNLDNIKKDKMDPSSRSHSLSDLSTGLTLSLIGQKKYDSVVSVNSQSKSVISSGNGRRHATIAASSLQNIEDRFMGTALSCQGSVTSLSSLYNNSKLQTDQDNQYSSTSNVNGYHQVNHQTEQNAFMEQPYQQKNQNQQFEYFQHKPHQQMDNEYPVTEERSHSGQQMDNEYPVTEERSHSGQQMWVPRSRKDSEDTVSSHRSALSDVRSFQGADNKYNNRTNGPAQTSDTNKVTSRTINPFSCVSARSTVSCLKENATSDKAHSAVVNSHQVSHQNIEQSVVKPRRSLPNVPLNEASERIKRFTEMMKSRMSANSANKNSRADSCGSSYAPSRMSSTGSACSQTGPSTRTPSDPSDGDVFLSATSSHYQVIPGLSQQNGFLSVHEVSRPQDVSKEGMCSPRKSSGYYSGSDSGVKHAGISVNRRSSIKEEVSFENFDQRMNNNNMLDKNGDGFSHRNFNQNEWQGQCQNMLTLGEMQLVPAADQSLDSGRTTETNNSYNGSVLDSGYTTNNDGENDSCRGQPPRLSNYHHNIRKEYSQHADHPHEISKRNDERPHHHEISLTNARNDETPPCNHHHSHKYFVNLVNTHNFGSVQNIFQKSHGNPKDFNLVQRSHVVTSDKHQHVASESLTGCYNKIGNKNTSESIKNGSSQAVSARNMPPVKQLQDMHLLANRNMPPVKQLQLQDMHLSANRRSWDCANDAVSSCSDGFSSNQMKRYERVDERYRSSDVLPSSRGFVDRNFLGNHQAGRSNFTEYRQLKTSKQLKATSENSVSDSEIEQLNGVKEFTPVLSPARDVFNHYLSDHNHEHPQTSHKTTFTGNIQQGFHKAADEDNHDYRLSHANHQQQDEVKPQQVPASRVARSAWGYTQPVGTVESDCTFQHYPALGQEMSLFHMTQKYDLAPVLINLPQDMLLKDMIELSEFSVQMSLVGVSALPNSPHGRAPQIGTPGSAFTPVKNSIDRDKPLSAELKVLCFCGMWKDIHKYTTLGRLLKGDIILEVNGWFCLGADVAYVRKLLENCKETITFTVARLKESDDVRFKGQTAVERIKGLESEISRLDDLIQTRDDKIKSLTVAKVATNFNQHTGTLSEINGKIPLEGMIIGSDEYVV